MKMKLPGLTALAATLALGASLTPAAAQGQATIRASYWVAQTAMPAPEWEKWLKSMEAASNGALKVQIFPAGQLGKAADHYDLARDGVVDLAWAVPGFNAGRFPIYSVSELPLIFSDAPVGAREFDKWYAKYAAKEMGDVHYCLGHISPLSTLNFTAKAVNAPDEMKGIRVRPQNATSGRFFASLGANIVQVSAAEAKQAFDRGVADAIAFPWRTLYPFNLQTSVKFHMDLPLTSAPSVWVMNKAKYQSLPPAAKAAVDSHCTPEWAQKLMQAWQDWEGEGRKMLTDAGNTIYKPSADNVEKWKKAASDFHQTWVTEVTKPDFDAKTALDDFKKVLGAAKAGY